MEKRTLTFAEWMVAYVYKALHYSKAVEKNEGVMKVLRQDYQSYVVKINNQ